MSSIARQLQQAVGDGASVDAVTEFEKASSQITELRRFFENRYDLPEFEDWPIRNLSEYLGKVYDGLKVAELTMDRLKEGIEGLKSDIDGLQGYIDDLTSEKTELEQDLAIARSEVHALANATNQTPDYMRNFMP